MIENQNHELTVHVERMTYGPDAIAHTRDGRVVFVTGGIAGDIVRVDVYDVAKSFLRARVTEVVEASPERIKPACPYAWLCGGCPWAALSPAAQHSAKRANVIDALIRIGHLVPEKAESLVMPCEVPSSMWGYRNKVELAVVYAKGRATIGMHGFKPGSNSLRGSECDPAHKPNSTQADKDDLIQVKSCPLLDTRHMDLIGFLSGALCYLLSPRDLGISRVGLRVAKHTRDIEVSLWGKPGPFPRGRIANVLKDAIKPTSAVRILTKGAARHVSGVEVLSGKGHWEERLRGERMAISAPSFFQVNTAGAQHLVALVLEGLSPSPSDVAIDLYAGAGTFTVPLARLCAQVYAVESERYAVRDLRRNLQIARCSNVCVTGGDAGQEFPDVDADIIVVDPPRCGLAPDVVKKLSAQHARAIAYVSCDPATLARDIGRFVQLATFSPTLITPVDLFPQTFHVETVVLMSRKARRGVKR